MNRCTRCGKLLVLKKTAEAIDGKLYCSRHCALLDVADKFLHDSKAAKRYSVAMEIAKDYFDDCSETISTEDVLAEDFQEVQIAVTYYNTVKVPKCLSHDKAIEVVEKMWVDGKVKAEPDDYEDLSIACVLVNNTNSPSEDIYNDK